MRLILVEAFGMLWGPVLYARAHRRARALAQAAGQAVGGGE